MYLLESGLEDGDVTVSRLDTAADKATATATINANFEALNAEVTRLAQAHRDINMAEVNRTLGEIKEQVRKQDEALVSRGRVDGGGDDEFRRTYVDEGKVRLMGKKDHMRGWQPGLLDDDAVVTGDWHAEARRLVTLRTIARMALPTGGAATPDTPQLDSMLLRHLQHGPAEVARTFSGATSLGSEWGNVTVLPMVMEALRLPAMPVEDLFPTIDLRGPSVTLPVSTTLPRAYRYGKPGSTPAKFAASDLATDSRSVVAQGLAVMVPVFDDASEDAVIDAGQLIMGGIVTGLRLSTVDAIINGDTAASHQDAIASWNPGSIFDANATYGGSDDPRRAWLGLRADAYDNSATRDASADTTFAGSGGTLPTAMAALKSPHGAAGDLVYLTSFAHYIAKIATDANILTVDKYGPNATILKGEAGAIYGRVKVVISELVTADLAATGLYTGSGSYSAGILFNRQRWVMGVRKGVTTEIERRASEGVNYMVAVRRCVLKKVDATGDKTVHVSFKV